MARSKNQFLQNVRTTKKYSPEVIAQAELKYGEIAVFQNADEPSLGIKVGETKYAQFKDSEAVTAEITSAKTELNTTISSHTTKIGELEAKFGKYATSADTVSADEKVLSSAKTYTDTLKGNGYTNETLAGLKSEINSLKGDSDTTVEALASRVTQAETDIDALETTVGDNKKGLVKDVADLKTKFDSYATSADTVAADTKTLNNAKSYTDSQIKAIKGGDGTTTETISSLKGEIEANSSAISGIKDSTKLDSFKDVEDEINLKISSVYKIKGTKNTYTDLPTEGNTIGDVYNVKAANGNTPAGTNYVCTASAGTREEQWDALGGTIDLSGYVSASSFNTLEQTVTGHTTDITNLKASASTLNTEVQKIKGWKINDKFISGSPILNGKDIKVDDAEGAQTLKDAIASAKTAGDNAMTYAQGVSGSVKTLNDTVDKNKNAIDEYTINDLKISEKPVLTGENVLVGGTSEDKAKTLNTTIAEAKAAGTEASKAITTLRGGYEGTIKSINDSVTTNTSDITKLRNDVNGVSATTITAVQTITVTNTGTNGIKAEKTGTNVTFNFDNMVIDCGEF